MRTLRCVAHVILLTLRGSSPTKRVEYGCSVGVLSEEPIDVWSTKHLRVLGSDRLQPTSANSLHTAALALQVRPPVGEAPRWLRCLRSFDVPREESFRSVRHDCREGLRSARRHVLHTAQSWSQQGRADTGAQSTIARNPWHT
jgi:hypothetical protein